MSSHAACSPSSAAMWLVCPASVTKTKGVPRPSSKFAREGTAAHAVAEMTLKGDVFLPDRVEVEGEQFIVSPGMCRALRPYVDHVHSLASQPGAKAFFEHRVKVPGTFGIVWGTLDCGVQLITGDVHIVDLKFGKGHFVEANTPQLRLYALGFLPAVLTTFDDDIKVTLTICQPRVGDEPVRSFETTVGALVDWLDTTVRPAVVRIKSGDESEVAGPHCRWCVRKPDCAAFAGKHQKHAAAAFDD